MDKTQNRIKLFITNIFVYGLGGVMSKAVPLIMVPIITRLFPNSFYYGMSDLATTIISLFTSLAIMGMYDAMYRMFFENDDEKFKKDICSSAFFFTCISSTIVAIIMVILQVPISSLFFSDPSYGNLVMLCALSVLIGGTNSIISAPTRMQNKKGIFLLTNTLSPILSYSIAIPLILNGYYLIALPLAMIISAFTLELAFLVLNHKWFSFKCINWSYIKSMLKIAIPLLPNFLIYWIFNSSDRVMITNILGADFSGIYAVGAKIGQVSQLIYLAFAGGWQFFSFSIMKDNDNANVITKVFEILMIISLLTTLIVTSICKFGMELLFTSDYWSSYICVPYLYFAPLLQMLFQVGSNQFLVAKKTWPNIIILSVGAIINICFNLIFIPIIGIEGASIASIIGYLVSTVLCYIVLLKMRLININWKIPTVFGVFVCFFLIMRFNEYKFFSINILLIFVFLAFLFVIYFRDIKYIFYKIMKR